MRDRGIAFPAYGVRVNPPPAAGLVVKGSKMVTAWPALLNRPEKSPRRSARVGIVSDWPPKEVLERCPWYGVNPSSDTKS